MLGNYNGSCDGINESALLGTDEGTFEGSTNGTVLGVYDSIL